MYFSCTSLVPTNTLNTNWFIRKRGFALSLTNTGLSIGGIIYLGVSGAATAVSITAGASIIGRLWLGTIVDRCDKRYVMMICLLIQCVAVIALAYFQHVVILYLGTFAFGLTMGNIIMMQSRITGECFGLISFATVSGLAGVLTMAGAAFGPSIAGYIFDMTQS